MLPDVRLQEIDAEGALLPLANFPCLINFWATWCPPCRAEMASLNRLFLTYRAQGLGVFAVSVDEDAHLVREFLVKLPLAFPILLDPGAMHAKQDFRVAEFPTTFLVDRSRRIRDVWVGERDWDAPEVRQVAAAMLAA